jgi:hypothetical protein
MIAQPVWCKKLLNKVQCHVFVQPGCAWVFSSRASWAPQSANSTGLQMPMIKLPIYAHRSTRLIVGSAAMVLIFCANTAGSNFTHCLWGLDL